MTVESLSDAPISVEVQIRTILDDAWARISQRIDYKRSNIVSVDNKNSLKKIRAMIDKIEDTI